MKNILGIAFHLTNLVFCLVLISKTYWKDYRWKQLKKYLEPYNQYWIQYMKENGIKENSLISTADLYRMILKFMEQENILNKKYNIYLHREIAKEEEKAFFVVCETTGSKYKMTHELCMPGQMFDIGRKS